MIRNGRIFILGALIFLPEIAKGQSPITNSPRNKPVYFYLVAEDDKETQIELGLTNAVPEGGKIETNAPPSEEVPWPEPKGPNETDIDDIINKHNSPNGDDESKKPLEPAQLRVLAMVEKDEKNFIELLNKFATMKFDPRDEDASPEFVEVREKIVKIFFRSFSDETYMKRIYLINRTWLANRKEIIRFGSLKKAIRDRWAEGEQRHQRVRQVVTTITTIAGTLGGAYVGYRWGKRVYPIVATEKNLAAIGKWAGRVPFILGGAYLGKIIGQTVGLLGTEILHNGKDLINPIDGDEDLRVILNDLKKY